jgi:hypothetical protein
VIEPSRRQVGNGFALAAMTSARGRSHTFDRRADGYARGEACDAVAMRGNVAAGVVGMRGSAVRQDGRSASLTAPNGVAQQAVVVAAAADAAVHTDALALVETHGTGTALGDPIEMGALAATVLAARQAPLAVGSVKASVGHAEPAAGMIGLLQLLLSMRHCKAAPNAQLRIPNSHVQSVLCGVACKLPTQPLMLALNCGSVSSFGFGGTLAHAVLRDATGSSSTPSQAGVALVPLAHRRRAFPWWQVGAAHSATTRAICTASASSSHEAARAPKPYDVAQGDVRVVPKLIEHYVCTHARSRTYVAGYRAQLADNRNISNFSRAYKDTIHPIVATSALGARVRDVDGNELVDVAGGFGPILFVCCAASTRAEVSHLTPIEATEKRVIQLWTRRRGTMRHLSAPL